MGIRELPSITIKKLKEFIPSTWVSSFGCQHKRNPACQSSWWLSNTSRTWPLWTFFTTCRELRFERPLSHKTFNSTLLIVLTMFKYFIENIFLWKILLSFLNWKWPELMWRGQNLGKKWMQSECSCSELWIQFRILSVCLSACPWSRGQDWGCLVVQSCRSEGVLMALLCSRALLC